MVFSSQLFLFYFLPIALLLYYFSFPAWRNLTLTVASYAFYGWASPFYLVLIAWSTLVDYCCGNLIGGYWRLIGTVTVDAKGDRRASEAQRRLFLAVSLASNIGLLLFFKYFAFFQENLNSAYEGLGYQGTEILKILLPVGISFYTFESISYSVDIYQGNARPALAWVIGEGGGPPRSAWGRLLAEAKAMVAFACYITQFPHLVAGPIIRYQDLEGQIHLRTHDATKFSAGVYFFALGLAKKVLIANPISEIADAAFHAGRLHWLDAWYGIVAYAFQIYFDFSGYFYCIHS
ncbi:MAG: hypothetical protein K2W96_23720 [Gemmataceae bacterium]|nr:hypothetical protein [Gemmataceae bacterium]